MPVISAKHRQNRSGITAAHRSHLDLGFAFPFLDGVDSYGWTVDGDWVHPPNDDPELRAEMQSLWDVLKDELTAERIKRFPGTRCWAFWEFDAKRDKSTYETVQLHAMGLLSATELEAAKKFFNWKGQFAWSKEERAIAQLEPQPDKA